MTEHRPIDPKNPDEATLSYAIQTLQKGGIVAFPTDTIYALGVNILIPEAVQKVYEVKQRAKSRPLPILLAKPEQLSEFINQISPSVQKLIQTFWPGPLTLFLHCDKGALATQKVGFRVPDYPIAKYIVEKAGVPIGCPSANLSGHPGPTNAEEVLKNLEGKIDLVLDAGPTPIGKESTVVEMDRDRIKFLRNGYISQELIDTCLNRPTLEKNKIRKVLFVCTGNSCRSVIAEGFFNKLVEDKKPVRAISAGTTAFPGIRPSENGVLVMREQGIDISRHLSQALTPELISNSDLIIAMTRGHERFILEIAKQPSFDKAKVHLLMNFSSRWDFFGMDVEDPIGQPIWAYRQCFNMIKDPITRLVEAL